MYGYSTVTLFARFRGWSTSQPRRTAMWYASSCSGTTATIGIANAGAAGRRSTASLRRIEHSIQLVRSLGRERNDRSAARLDFLHVAEHLLEHVVVRRQRDDRHLLVDERDRTVLHLAGGVALGVDVRDFFQLQRAFERDGVVNSPTEIQEVTACVEAARDLLDLPARASAPAPPAAAGVPAPRNEGRPAPAPGRRAACARCRASR